MMQKRAFVLIGYVEEQGRVVVCERTVSSHDHQPCWWLAQAPLGRFTRRAYRLVESSATCDSRPIATDVAILSLPQWGKVAAATEQSGVGRLTDEVSLTQSNSSSTTTVVPLLPQEKANWFLASLG